MKEVDILKEGIKVKNCKDKKKLKWCLGSSTIFIYCVHHS